MNESPFVRSALSFRASAVAAGLAFCCLVPLRASDVAWTVNKPLDTPNGTIMFSMFSGEVWDGYNPAATFTISNYTGTYQQTLISGNGADNKVIYDFTEAKNVDEGSSVSASDPFWGSGNLATDIPDIPYFVSNFPAASPGFVGLTFTDENSATFYGWASIIRQPDSTFFTLVSFGYNSDPGQPATVGAVPEPGTAGLLVGVAAAFVAWRRFRRQT